MTLEDILTEELAVFLIQANLDLMEAEESEMYEQCKVICAAIQLRLNAHAEDIAYVAETSSSGILKLLSEQNNHIYTSLKDNWDNLKTRPC